MKNYLEHKLEENSIFQTRFDDGGFVVWRPLSWSDFKKYREARNILGNKIDLDIEKSVYEKCVIFSTYDTPPPEEADFNEFELLEWLRCSREEQPAGVIPTVVKTIMNISGATTGKRIIQQLNVHRPNIYNIEDHMVILICQAFPAYKPEDVEAMDWQELLKRAAQAEAILGQPIQLHDPEEEARRAAIEERKKLNKEINEALAMQSKGRTPDFEDILSKEEKEAALEEQKQRSREMTKLREKYLRERGLHR